MKIAKRVLLLLPVLLVVFAAFITGCGLNGKSEVKKIISNELDLLKNLDSETAQKYISYKELFPDISDSSKLTYEINEVFSLFFRDFDYKILDISVDKEKKTASASLRLTTIDAQTLAQDFAAAFLKAEILEAAEDTSGNTSPVSFSAEEPYLLLNHLLKTKEYSTAETSCTMQLKKGGGRKESWEIKRTYSLENDLVGGLMTYLSDPDILSPEATLTVYLNTLKKMNVNQMSSYLGVTGIMNSEDSSKNSIAAALAEQVHKNFNYEILSCDSNGYRAVLTTEITTFDSDAILEEHHDILKQYLDSPNALIDGSEKRYRKTFDLLLECIKKNEKTITSKVDFTLTNNGISWKLKDEGSVLGDAIFGILTAVEEEDSEEYYEDYEY